MTIATLKERISREFGTPAVVIDLDRVDRNIGRVQAFCEARGVKNRPHIKTHKSPLLARMQVAAASLARSSARPRSWSPAASRIFSAATT